MYFFLSICIADVKLIALNLVAKVKCHEFIFIIINFEAIFESYYSQFLFGNFEGIFEVSYFLMNYVIFNIVIKLNIWTYQKNIDRRTLVNKHHHFRIKF